MAGYNTHFHSEGSFVKLVRSFLKRYRHTTGTATRQSIVFKRSNAAVTATRTPISGFPLETWVPRLTPFLPGPPCFSSRVYLFRHAVVKVSGVAFVILLCRALVRCHGISSVFIQISIGRNRQNGEGFLPGGRGIGGVRPRRQRLLVEVLLLPLLFIEREAYPRKNTTMMANTGHLIIALLFPSPLEPIIL